MPKNKNKVVANGLVEVGVELVNCKPCKGQGITKKGNKCRKCKGKGKYLGEVSTVLPVAEKTKNSKE